MPMTALTRSIVTTPSPSSTLKPGSRCSLPNTLPYIKPNMMAGTPNRGEDPAEPHAALLIHVQPHEYEYYALADVAEHHAEEQTVRKREEHPRVGLSVGRNAVHINERAEYLCQLAFLELDGHPAASSTPACRGGTRSRGPSRRARSSPPRWPASSRTGRSACRPRRPCGRRATPSLMYLRKE